jgi:hypothetical protein
MIPSSTRYGNVRAQIEDGDLLLFRRPDSWLARDTDGVHSHSAMALWRGSVLAMGESQERLGARVVTLSSQVAANPGVIDVYKPQCPTLVKRRAADLMFRQAGNRYGYLAGLRYLVTRLLIVNSLLQKLGLLTLPEEAKEPAWDEAKFCSCQTEWCYRCAADELRIPFDPHPGLPSQFITPNDQAHTPAFVLAFGGLTL